MDTRLAIASKRDERHYSDRTIPDEVVTRILDAGRLSGNSRNRQAWEFVVVSDPAALADTVYLPHNLRSAALVIAIVAEGALDAGRAAQNMMLAAWDEGIFSCPNGVADPEGAERIVGAKPTTIISFGYPRTPRDPSRRSAEEWSERANRKPLDQLVRYI
jgi:nitroreductase